MIVAGVRNIPGKAQNAFSLGRGGQMGFGYTEADDKGAVIGKHRLVPGGFRLQLRKARADPIQDLFGACAMVGVFDSRQIVLKAVQLIIYNGFLSLLVCEKFPDLPGSDAKKG